MLLGGGGGGGGGGLLLTYLSWRQIDVLGSGIN